MNYIEDGFIKMGNAIEKYLKEVCLGYKKFLKRFLDFIVLFAIKLKERYLIK